MAKPYREADMGTIISEEEKNEELSYILGIKKEEKINSLLIDQLIRKGFSTSVGDRIKSRLNITDAELIKVAGVSGRTFQRKRSENKKFSSLVSDRIFRIIHIWIFATQVFEDNKRASDWMHKPQIGLGGRVPMDLLQTEAGEKAVEDLLGRIEYSVIS